MQFRKKSLKGQAFDTLSASAQFQIRFDESSTDEEKFIVCVKFAVMLQQYINFGNAEAKIIFNHNIIMRKIKDYLDSGIHPDIMVDGYPALYHALSYPQLVGLLLAKGANPDILYSYRKRTVMHLAAIIIDSPYYFTDNLFLTAEILAAYGADLELKDSEGIKAFDFIKGLLLRDKSLLPSIKARFKQVTEKPREIELLNTLYQPVSSRGFLLLTQTDLERISLYQQGKFTDLLETDGLYQFIARMKTGFFGTHELPQSSHQNSRGRRITTNIPRNIPPYQRDRYFWLTKGNHEQKLPGRCRAAARKIIDDAMLMTHDITQHAGPCQNPDQPVTFEFHNTNGKAWIMNSDSIAPRQIFNTPDLERLKFDNQPGQVSALITQSAIFTAPPKDDKKKYNDIEDDFVILSGDNTETIEVKTTEKEQKRGCSIS